MMTAAWRRPWQIALQRWRTMRATFWCFATLALIALAALSAPFLTLLFGSQLPSAVWQPPAWDHWLGTDHIGREVLLQLLWATRASFAFALAASGMSLALGALFGAFAGYYGGWWQRCLMRGMRVLESLPLLLIVIGIAASLRLEWMSLAILAGAVTWTPIARVVQRRVQRLRRSELAKAVQIAGARPARVLWHHIAPHLTSAAQERALLSVAHMLLLDAALGVLDLGPPAPRASLGTMLAAGVAELDTHPHLFIAAAVLLTAILYCLTTLADSWRDLQSG